MFITVLALLPVFAGCGKKENGSFCTDTVNQERAAWNAAGIADYEMRYRHTGWTSGLGTWDILVSNATVSAVSYAGTGPVPYPPMTVGSAPTIPDLFAQIERNCPQTNVTASYDSVYHYPKSAYFDAGSEGDGFALDAFAPL